MNFKDQDYTYIEDPETLKPGTFIFVHSHPGIYIDCRNSEHKILPFTWEGFIKTELYSGLAQCATFDDQEAAARCVDPKVWELADVLTGLKPSVPLYAPGDVLKDQNGSWRVLIEAIPEDEIWVVACEESGCWGVSHVAEFRLYRYTHIDPSNFDYEGLPVWLRVPKPRPFDQIPTER